VGAALAVVVIRALYPSVAEVARDLIVPHRDDATEPETRVDGAGPRPAMPPETRSR
jgi:hypothetical protein